MIEILGEKYREKRGKKATLWRGDLLFFDDSCGSDCRVYMVTPSEDHGGFNLINYIGYKAGLLLLTTIPAEAAAPGCQNIRLSWLKKNWADVIPLGTYKTTKFYAWSSE
ncbi:MAG: hypothetical protein ACSHWS_12470 [Sulfitobacter sp.]